MSIGIIGVSLDWSSILPGNINTPGSDTEIAHQDDDASPGDSTEVSQTDDGDIPDDETLVDQPGDSTGESGTGFGETGTGEEVDTPDAPVPEDGPGSESDVVDLDDDDTPLGETPDDGELILDGDTPMAGSPDALEGGGSGLSLTTAAWVGLIALAVIALASTVLYVKKRKIIFDEK